MNSFSIRSYILILSLALNFILSHFALGEEAQKIDTKTEFNKILFSILGQSWTSRDQQAYELVLYEVFKKKKLSGASGTELEDFLLSRLSEKESSLFDLSYNPIKVSDQQRKKMIFLTNTEVNREVEMISKAMTIIDLKETQQKDPDRFKAWLELLKRKYQLKMKTS